MRRYLTQAEVAAGLRRSTRTFRRQRPDLEAAGFPPPAAANGNRPLWDPAAVQAWQDRQMQAASPAPSPEARAAVAGDLAPDWTALLIARARKL